MPMSAAQASRSIASTDAFREIVQQVRSGQKTNAEMFEALRELARNNMEQSEQKHSETPQQTRAHEAPDGVVGGASMYANSVQLAKFSPADRKKLVSKIIEQRRNQQRRRNQSWVPGSGGRGIDIDHPRVAAAVQDINSVSDIFDQDEADIAGDGDVEAGVSGTDDSSAELAINSQQHDYSHGGHGPEREGDSQIEHQEYEGYASEEDVDDRAAESYDAEQEDNSVGDGRAVEQRRGIDSQRVNGTPGSAKPPNETSFNDGWDEHVDALVDEEDDVRVKRAASMYMMGSQKFRDSHAGGLDESGMTRSKRFSRSLLDLRQEAWKDYTFKPSIKKLPSYYGPRKEEGEPFYQRVMRWSQTRESEIEEQRQKAAHKEVASCTFTPRLNPNSKRAVQAIRAETDMSASDRLYKQLEVIKQNKQRLEAEHERKQREAEEKACTFQPRLVSTPKYREYHTPDFMERSRSWAEKSIMSRKDDEPEYPFQPKINGIKENMTAARLYTGTPVVERLTRNYAADDSFIDDGTLDRPSMDAKSFIGSIQGSRPKSAPHSRASRELTPAELQQRQKAFQMFLARQNNTLVRKESKIKAIAAQQATKFQPRLCQRSLDMTEEQNRGTFMDRLERDRLRREHDEQRKAIMSQAVPHSFKPELTKKSAKMRARTAHEMSKGDLMKRETNQRLLRLRMEQAQLSEMTFKPRISPAGQANTGKLRLSASTEQYLATIKAMQKRKHDKAVKAQQEREMNELEGCTFAPETIECPTYIQRISQSMKIAKAMRSTDEPPARPDWR